MSGLFVIGILLNPPAAAALDTGLPPAETGDTTPPLGHTGDTDTDTDTDEPLETGVFVFPSADTGAPFCDTCVGAGDLAGDPGGSPCQQGCSTRGAGPALWLGLVPLALARRRQSRSYST